MTRRTDYIFHAIWSITTIMAIGTIFHLFTRYAVVERSEATQLIQGRDLAAITQRLDKLEQRIAEQTDGEADATD